MTAIIQKVSDLLDETERNADPRVRDWFLMSSPLSPILVLAVYLYFVQKLGPLLMKNRPAFQIEKIIIIYNALQVITNAYLIEEVSRLVWFKGDYRFQCIEIDYSDTEEGRQKARTVWLYFITKFLDLLDTVFFVLRKKQSQVTFLHVYHHSLVFSFGWIIVKYFAGGHVAFFGTVNAFVHMIMYTYYLITALHLVKNEELWWKKYITQLQLFQFILTGVHASLALFAKNCSFPKFLIAIGIPQDIFMITLFWDFYRKSYILKSRKSPDNSSKTGAINDIKSKNE